MEKEKTSLKSYLRQHRYAVRIVFQQLSQHPIISLLIVFFLSLFLIPIFIVVSFSNINNFKNYFQASPQITIYLKKQLSPSETDVLIHQLKSNRNIVEVKFVSAEEGLKEFMQALTVNEIDKQLGENPLPPSLVLKLRMIPPSQLTKLNQDLKRYPQIDMVIMDQQWLQRLFALTTFITAASRYLFIIFCSSIVVLMVITLHSLAKNLQDELNIYHLLGANKKFIRRPMLYFGTTISLLASMCALFFSIFLSGWIVSLLQVLFPNLVQNLPFQFSLKDCVSFFILSGSMGWVTALLFALCKTRLH